MNKITKTVIENDYCIGCGACAVSSNAFKIKVDEYGKYLAQQVRDISDKEEEIVNKVCPFSNDSLSETNISDKVFNSANLIKNDYLGSYDKLFFGHSNELRKNSASGGLTTWFLLKSLEVGLIDAVIHLKERANSDDSLLFEYGISYSAKELKESAATKYYPGELSNSLRKVIEGGDLRYAIVGVPCFIKSVRLLEQQNEILKSRIKLHIGLVCGHYKSSNYALMLAWQKQIQPDTINTINFRYKSGKGKAGDYNTRIEYSSNEDNKLVKNEPVKSFYGTDWGLGMFKYNACDFCDDVVAETADVVFGDAWISPFVNDPMGTNIVITRDPTISKIFIDADKTDEDLFLQSASVIDIIKTQSAGFRHRREGLQLRLFWKEKSQNWFPRKRFKPDPMNKLSFRYKLIYKTRIQIAKLSHIYFKEALRKGSFELFTKKMAPIVFYYKYILYGPNRLKIYLMRFLKAGN